MSGTSSVRDAAREHLRRGWAPIPVPSQSKNPNRPGWQHERFTDADVESAYPAGSSNISLLPGEPSNGVVDIDLDAAEARWLADAFLPPTGSVFGRASSRWSHRLYQITGEIPTTTKFADPTVAKDTDRAMLLELRSSGCHTLIPPSVHPIGEAITWEQDGTPGEVGADALLGSCRRLAAASLLARHWPGEGTRNDAALAFAGGLLRAGWEVGAVASFVQVVAEAAGDEEAVKRGEAARSTAAQLKGMGLVTGWPTLAKVMDDKIVKRVEEWLGVKASARAGQGGNGDRESSQASVVVELAMAQGIELFHDSSGDPYCSFQVDDHLETWPLRSKHVRGLLSRLHYQGRGKVPGTQALQDALQVLEGEARFAGEERAVAVRLADHGGTLHLDLGDPLWRVVIITPGRWAIVPAAEVPVRFRRPRGLLALPEPISGGKLNLLKELLNVSTEEDLVLLIGWLVGCLYPRGPRAVLQLLGEQGSAKSTGARLLRSLVDPNLVPLRTQPKDEGDLLIAATNGLLVALDNLSELPRWLSDALCRLATGGGLSKRELYTDSDEVLLDARRPVLLTAIAEVATASDLLDRCVTVTLPPIPSEIRRTEGEIERLVDQARPQALGALLDAAASALEKLPTTQLDRRPRLADFATWVEAAAPSLGWEPGVFLDALEANRKTADAVAIEALPIGPVLLSFMQEQTEEWVGTATELLALLNGRVSDEVKRERGWPKRANGLAGQLRRLAPNLRRVGVWVGSERRSGSGERRITLTKNTEAWDRHHRHDRHTDQESGTKTTRDCDDPCADSSSQDRHTSSQDTTEQTSTSGTEQAESPAGAPSCDDSDDGDDVWTHPSQEEVDSTTAERTKPADPDAEDGYEEWEL